MDSVQVAVRVRPLVQYEIETGCRTCIDVIPELQQIVTKLKNEKFTFNHVFDSNTPQVDVYENAIQDLVKQLFKGYNVTVLAYGQTGSGKTFSMGTNPATNNTDQGIIPRAIADMFEHMNNAEDWVFNVSVSFLELYNEQLIDLLSERGQATVDLRESNRGIVIPGLTQRQASSATDIISCLNQGSMNRTTGATAMNAQSSRSHAIFTIYLQQSKINNEDEAMSAKFHLVDLAGSERSKKTKAEGKRFQEGVNINKELFVLGNVISALCVNAPFINYRDSKLTRLLQDSLGGNSLTLMLACVSPADSNLDETVNTLRYADRARKIKNKPVVNQDPTKQEINRLKQQVENLQLLLLSKGGDFSCPPEHKDLEKKNQALLEKNKLLSSSLDNALGQTTTLLERTLMAEAARDRMKVILASVNMEFNQTLEVMDSNLNDTQKCNLHILKDKLDELKNEHEKSETERIKYEEQLMVKTPAVSHGPHSEEKGAEEDEETRQEFVLEQAKLNEEIQELSKDLAWKEALAVKLAESNSMEASIGHSSNDKDISELKSQINSLIQEKAELEKQLKSQRSTNIDHRLAEQRRIRVKELEEKISALNKKVIDQDRVIRMKERNDEKIRNLNKEIMSMKQAKVRLINQMKTDGEKYRHWRSSREQEVCKLRQQNSQKETKLAKMENYYQKQQHVYKRKLEESSAVIKRLKETLALQKSTRDKKLVLGNAEKVNQWVTQEFSTMVNTLEAERTLENLIEDRTLLAKELTKLKESQRDSSLGADEQQKISVEIKSLNDDLELRSTQIVDLKQKLQSLDDYQEKKGKSRWDCVNTMADAKIALKYVFETANTYLTELHKDKNAKESALEDLQESYQAILHQLQEKEDLLKEEGEKLKRMETDHNDKVFLLLKRLKEREALDSSKPLQDASRFNISMSEDIENKDTIESLQKKVKELEEKLENRKANKPKKTTTVSNWNAAITPETRKRFFDGDDDDEIIDEDDADDDPDWTKTPIFRRLQTLKASSKVTTCSCKGDCRTKHCSCKKNSTSCTGLCKCSDELCKNKSSVSMSPSDESNTDDSLNKSNILFKKPRLM